MIDKNLRAKLTLPVVFLSFGSLFTDIAGESAYSVLPLFLTQVLGAGALSLGLIEGIAESTASVLKFFSGYWADRLGKSKPIVLLGYTTSGLAKPVLALAGSWPVVLAIRFVDRVGKGIRGAPRDAWIAKTAGDRSPSYLFGFQRAMDNLGAVIGPLLATLYLAYAPGQYRSLFSLTVIPGILAVIFIAFAKEKDLIPVAKSAVPPKLLSWSEMPAPLKKYFAVLFLFTLGNSTDAFLLLRLKDVGVPIAFVPACWALLHVVKVVTSLASGWLSEKLGVKPLIVIGWAIFAACYLTMGFSDDRTVVLTAFFVYGIYFGFTEAPERTFISFLSPRQVWGRAYGLYAMTMGLGALPASLLFGLLWQSWGPEVAFATGATLAGLASLGLMKLVLPKEQAI